MIECGKEAACCGDACYTSNGFSIDGACVPDCVAAKCKTECNDPC